MKKILVLILGIISIQAAPLTAPSRAAQEAGGVTITQTLKNTKPLVNVTVLEIVESDLLEFIKEKQGKPLSTEDIQTLKNKVQQVKQELDILDKELDPTIDKNLKATVSNLQEEITTQKTFIDKLELNLNNSNELEGLKNILNNKPQGWDKFVDSVKSLVNKITGKATFEVYETKSENAKNRIIAAEAARSSQLDTFPRDAFTEDTLPVTTKPTTSTTQALKKLTAITINSDSNRHAASSNASDDYKPMEFFDR